MNYSVEKAVDPCGLSKYGNGRFYYRRVFLKMTENSSRYKKIEILLSGVLYLRKQLFHLGARVRGITVS